MTWKEFKELDIGADVLLKDGEFGQVHYWVDCSEEVGIRVVGNGDIRWINAADLFSLDEFTYEGRHALIERRS